MSDLLYLRINKMLSYPESLESIFLHLFQKARESITTGNAVFIDDTLADDHTILDYQYPGKRYLSFPYKISFTVVIICTRGALETRVNQRPIALRRGSVLIAQRGAVIEGLTCSGDFQMIAMAFDDPHTDLLFNRSAQSANTWIVHRAIPVCLSLGDDRLSMFIDLYKQIKQIWAETSPAHQDDVIQGFLVAASALFLSLLERQGAASAPAPGSRQEEIYLQFMDDLQLYAGRERQVSFYADLCCVSAKHFSRVIRSLSGEPPQKHIKKRVIIEAKALLGSTEKSIRQIADALHFPNDSFFCRYFKAETGISPLAYRAGAAASQR